MADETDLTETIRENAQGPSSATNDQGTFSQHNLRDQIEADRHLKGTEAAKSRPARGLRFNKLIPPGTI